MFVPQPGDSLRIAAIDVGTNTVRCLIADSGAALAVIERLGCVTALGEGMAVNRSLSNAARARTLQAIEQYYGRALELNSERVIAIATSAMRDAANGSEFVEEVRRATGLELRVISGDEEARMTFAGAAFGCAPAAGTMLVIDVGGGSTEFIVGKNGTIQQAISVNLGSRRQTTECRITHPVSPESDEALNGAVRCAMAGSVRSIPTDAIVVGVGGTVTTLAGLALRLEGYKAQRVHGFVLKRTQVEEMRTSFARATLEELARLPSLEPGRAEVLYAGTAIVGELLRALGCDALLVSTHGLLMGAALEA